jgi:hypothetical protein
MTISVEVRTVYGVEKVYPLDDAARAFARIAGTTTLTDYTIQQIKQLGYTIHVKQAVVSI